MQVTSTSFRNTVGPWHLFSSVTEGGTPQKKWCAGYQSKTTAPKTLGLLHVPVAEERKSHFSLGFRWSNVRIATSCSLQGVCELQVLQPALLCTQRLCRQQLLLLVWLMGPTLERADNKQWPADTHCSRRKAY